MTLHTRSILPGIAGAIALTLAPVAQAEPAPSPDELRALVSEVLADAETRSSLSGSSVGHDGAFFLADADGSFRLTIGGLIQFRYQYNHLDGPGEEDQSGFFLSRTRLWARGTVHDKVGFFIRGQFSGTKEVGFADQEEVGGVFNLDRAWVDLPLGEAWSIRFGQQASDFSRENEHAPQDQLGVNASATDSVFSLGGYQGVRLAYRGDSVRAFFTFSDGARNTNSEFADPRDADFALTFKGDWKLSGEWARFSDFTSRPGSDPAVMLGAGVHWENGAMVGDPADSLSLLGFIAELSVEGDGWSLFGAFNYFRNSFERTNGEDFDDFGFVVQGSFYLSDSIEPYARFDAVFPDSDRSTGSDPFRSITAGFNWYLFPNSSAAKFSFDAVYMLDSQSDSLVNPSNNTGVLASDSGDQISVRAQLTLVF